MIVRGYASTSDMDHVRHVVDPKAFASSVRERGLLGPKGIKLLFQHQRDKVLGRVTKLEVRNRGLWLEGEVDEEISFGKDVARMIEASGGLSFSVGFFPIDVDLEEDATGREYLLIRRGDLFEVSVVTFPCNEEAGMTSFGKSDGSERVIELAQQLNRILTA